MGNRKAPSSSSAAQSPQAQSTPAMGMGEELPSLNFDTYQQESEAALDKNQNEVLKRLQSANAKDNTASTQKDLAEFWEKEKNLNMAAWHYKKAAFLENTEKSITFAGNLFLAVMQKTEKPEWRVWQAKEAIGCFNKALQFNPENVDVKIALATCYTEGTGETMKGVTLLRDITSKDSTNIAANVILGKLAIQSGQFDKAIKRLELVLSLQAKNTEALYFLAEAYKGQGNKEKAIELFEKCKKMVNNPDFTKEIDQYINSFK